MVSKETCNFICCITLGILGVALFLTNIIFSFKYKEYDFEGNTILKEIMNNLNSKLILSLTEKEKCSTDETELSLGKWDGASSGCFCSENDIIEYKCTSYNKRDGCKDVGPFSSLTYKKINSDYLCIKQSKETYLDLLKSDKIISKNSECPSNYVSCGIVDTFGNKLCAENKDNCPISMEYFNENFKYKLENKNEDESFPIGYNNILNSDESQILSVFQLGEKNPCIYPGEKYWEPSSVLEPKEICYSNISLKFYDERYEKISVINTTKYQLYLDNGIPEFIKGKNTVVYLYGRSFMGFEKGKLDSFSYDSIISTQNLSNRCHNVMKILSTALLIFIGLPIFVVISCVCGTGGHPPNLQCSDKECGCILLTSAIGTAVTAVLAFVIDFILCIIVFACSLSLKIKLSIKYSDDISNELIQLLIDEGSKNFIFSLAIVSIIFLAIINGIILLVNYIRDGEIKC